MPGSDLRPGWLADDEQWRQQLDALAAEDAAWIERHWTLAGGRAPAVDTSWVTYESDSPGDFVPLLMGVTATTIAVTIVLWLIR